MTGLRLAALARLAAWALAALLLSLASVSRAQPAPPGLLDFSADELRRLAAHGPWPPPPRADAGNAWSGRPEAIALGRRLFHDARLSRDGRFSCASCHEPERGFADGLPRAADREGGLRNTPGLWNVGQQRWFGWGGEADSLWHQSLRALFNEREFDATPALLQRLSVQDEAYAAALRALGAPAGEEARAVALAKALGAYMATLTSPRTAFDAFRDALLSGDAEAAALYPAAAQRGARLFVGRAGCAICHVGPLFSNGEFADIGRPFFVRPGVVDGGRHAGIRALREGPLARYNLLGPFADAPLLAGPSASTAGAVEDPSVKTRHVDLQHRNFGEFKVPSLRGLLDTAPYMHDGALATLAEVVRHYNRIDLERLHADGDRILQPLGLGDAEERDLVAFLESLSAPEPQPRRLSLRIDLRQAIASGRFDPAHDGLSLRGSTPPLAWDRPWLLHRPGAALPPDAVLVAELLFPRAPRGDQPLAYKLKVERPGPDGRPTAEGWEAGPNHALRLDAPRQQLQRALDAAATPLPLRRTGRIERHRLLARDGSARELQVWLPPSYADAGAQDRRYPVLYLLDGQNVFDAQAAGAEWGLDEAAQSLMASGRIGEAILVAVASGPQRLHDYTPWAGPRPGAAAPEGGGAAAHARFLLEELKPFVDARYRSRPEREHTALGGSSLGGLFALWLALSEPQRIGAALVVSPSVWWAGRAVLEQVRTLPAGSPRPRLWLDVGLHEGREAVDGARALCDALQAQGWQAGLLRYTEDAEGQHDEASWAERAPDMLRFLYGAAPKGAAQP